LTSERDDRDFLCLYLALALGFILLALQFGRVPETIPDAIRFLSSKVGLAVVVLGGMHFFNMHAIARFGRKVGTWLNESRYEQAEPASRM
jgi:cytochrome c biogenesis protein CcdA